MNDLTLQMIKSNDSFMSIYEKLCTSVIDKNEAKALLSIAILFLRNSNQIINKLGYRIIVLYSNQYNDYRPLYEISINEGLYPISAFIDRKELIKKKRNIFIELNAAFLENYKSNLTYFTEQQNNLKTDFSENIEKSLSVIAPTSYGKTDLIITLLAEKYSKNICVLTPTKSLLHQTKKRIIDAKISDIRKIVVNAEMYNSKDKSCIAVLTQERLMRLLKDNPELKFDYVIIDEAHDLLQDSERANILATAIIILEKRNSNTKFKFLTPFLNNSESLTIENTDFNIAQLKINEYVKTEKIYVYDIRNKSGLSLYDQFLGKSFTIKEETSNLTDIAFILKHAAEKNIIYFNKPTDIERFAIRLINTLPDIEIPDDLEQAIENISEYVSENYYLVKALKKGVIYHHGSVPDVVRIFIEYLYQKYTEVKFVITSSTLLEGVNIPASKIFIMDNKKGKKYLYPSSFKNLIGRVCRFNEIFSNKEKDLKKLEPEIYLIVGDYYSKNVNIEKYLNKIFSEKQNIDKVENILLKNKDKSDEKDLKLYENAREFIENYEPNTIKDSSVRKVHTKIGSACIVNSVREFDIFENEDFIQESVEILFDTKSISDVNSLINIISDEFLIYAKDDDNLKRFENLPTRNYYKMFLSWIHESQPFNLLVSKTVKYWNSLEIQKKDTIVYVGKWGDLTKNGGHNKYWTDISTKNENEKINLAIVRIKEEQDFVSNYLLKYIEVLNDVNAIEDNFYNKLKYGTTNQEEIVLIKNGFSVALAKIIVEKYKKFYKINFHDCSYELNEDVIDEMKKNKENGIIIYETRGNII